MKTGWQLLAVLKSSARSMSVMRIQAARTDMAIREELVLAALMIREAPQVEKVSCHIAQEEMVLRHLQLSKFFSTVSRVCSDAFQGRR